jgi:hypothetical protein
MEPYVRTHRHISRNDHTANRELSLSSLLFFGINNRLPIKYAMQSLARAIIRQLQRMNLFNRHDT